MTDRTTAYFDDLVGRFAHATAIVRKPVAGARPNDCHANCERFVEANNGFQIVRGWLFVSANYFFPHSVVRERSSGRSVDVTPDISNSGPIRFVEHIGSEEDFQILRVGRNGGWAHPQSTGSPSDHSPQFEIPAD
ncbi:hypothetical protein EJ076_29565 [Mesorhizobium sp. M7D.F.Ca.US.005.01.1.1]|uniref:hypothetical protein n=1 Tax=Mesorhizobium sp. M7D.F.Ca.US.005.01.1.1 TaxID=2493678 RepID=UPI000F75CB78|nr:hypothetical protein [Mesorhizobium sp. M7D.F.Ca.US.005.01.1.1]AZO44956.1 hypothetical protein EJ076_29565 [Mesorhizobium sp. M7D.F.Ca.US.005.01.1.1]